MDEYGNEQYVEEQPQEEQQETQPTRPTQRSTQPVFASRQMSRAPISSKRDMSGVLNAAVSMGWRMNYKSITNRPFGQNRDVDPSTLTKKRRL
jgi:hypothetical protein